MHSNFQEFFDNLRLSQIENAYASISKEFTDPSDLKLAEELRGILTSHFIRQRQTKKNGLLNLKRIGFHPDIVIDVGAQTGTPELYSVFPDANHIFIEPVAECIPILNEIAATLNSVKILNCAVSNFNGNSNISLTDSKQYSSIDSIIGSENRSIEVKTIDCIIEELNLNGNVLLKIDVDGPEIKVLQGSKTLLKNDCIVVVEASISDKNPRFNGVVEYLSTFGFDVFDIVDPLYRQSDWHLWQVDLIFIKTNSVFWGSKSFV